VAFQEIFCWPFGQVAPALDRLSVLKPVVTHA
jgi:hypothetical protein